MKKKVKDLTREEFDKICDKYNVSCDGCPFQPIYHCRDLRNYLKFQDHLRMLEQEIEVLENDK